MANHRTRKFSQEAPVASTTVPPPAQERKLAEDTGQLAAILEAMADGVVVFDRDGRVLHVNPVARELLSLDPRSMGVPRTIREVGRPLNPRDERGQPLPEEQWPPSRALRGEILHGASALDVIFRTSDGRELLISESAAPVRDTQGQIAGAVVVLRDVTERRRLERQTHEALHALLAMAEALMQVPEAPHDASPTSEMAPRQAHDPKRSEAARRLAKLACRVLLCRTVSIVAVEPETALLHPITIIGLSPTQEARWWASWDRKQHLGERFDPGAVATLRAGKLVTPARVRLPLRPGQHRFPEYTVLLVPMQVGDTLLGVLTVERGGGQDGAPSPHWQVLVRAVARLGALVLDRERLLHERAVALASELALRETNEQMDTFVGIAGHEMKSPLTGVMLSLYLIERRIQHMVGRKPGGANEDAEPLLEHVALARRQVERLDRLVNDLLDATRVRAGKLEIHPETADLALLVREVVQEQRQLAPARDLLLRAPVALHVPVIADGERIKQVVTNYVTNALKYSPADRPVAVGITVNDQEARVWVRDEGSGLPAEEQAQIWERFHRAGGIVVQSGSESGLGLGLYICRTIIERHQGQVGVESDVGRGSTFWFTVPLDRRGVEHTCVTNAPQETLMRRHL